MSEPKPNKYANLRDSFVALREFIVVMVMLALLFTPSRVKQILDAAGIRSLAGLEFDTQALKESEAALAEAHRKVVDLKYELAFMQQDLEHVQTADSRTDHRIQGVLRHLKIAQRDTIETELNLTRSQEKNSHFLEQHGVATALPAERQAEVRPVFENRVER